MVIASSVKVDFVLVCRRFCDILTVRGQGISNKRSRRFLQQSHVFGAKEKQNRFSVAKYSLVHTKWPNKHLGTTGDSFFRIIVSLVLPWGVPWRATYTLFLRKLAFLMQSKRASDSQHLFYLGPGRLNLTILQIVLTRLSSLPTALGKHGTLLDLFLPTFLCNVGWDIALDINLPPSPSSQHIYI